MARIRREAAEALREADRRKDEFLAMLSHELRGPLAPLGNMLEVIRRAEGNAELIRNAHATMERQLAQLVRLVDDLLDVSRITRNKMELRKERVELATVVRQAVEACRPLADGMRHEVTVTLPPAPVYLHADPARLAQVFQNLVNNACKYTEPRGRIALTAERQGGDVVVTVKDTGLGIPADKLASIFDMFTQVDASRERAQGGLGIGLTLVKRLVEMHDGTVEARSEGPGGAARSSCACRSWATCRRQRRGPRPRPRSGRRSPAACWSWTTTWTPRSP
jgi:signal transduction histidine kinase